MRKRIHKTSCTSIPPPPLDMLKRIQGIYSSNFLGRKNRLAEKEKAQHPQQGHQSPSQQLPKKYFVINSIVDDKLVKEEFRIIRKLHLF